MSKKPIDDQSAKTEGEVLPSGRPDEIPPYTPPVTGDTHESVRNATARMIDPDQLDAAVKEALARHAPTDPVLSDLATAGAHVAALFEWAHGVYDKLVLHFGDKLELPPPPPKPGAGIADAETLYQDRAE